MTNPLQEVYDALVNTLRTDADLLSFVDFTGPDETDAATARQELAKQDRVGIAVVPAPGGTLENISSSRARMVERFELKPVSGYLSHRQALGMKWATVKAIWGSRNLGLDYVQGADVDIVEREAAVGTRAVDPHAVSWGYRVVISVSILLDRTTLPLG